MITYVNSSNLDKYEILFDRATDLLKNFNPSDPDSLFSQWKIVKAAQLGKAVNELTQEELAEFDDYKISSLNEYFAYLSTIANMSEEQLSKEDKSYFLSLPLDEDTFNIDANSRIVAVPASFAKNGIGIQSEELAEVIYFAIDRYYDSTDFASDDLSIAIQWEKGAESGLCRNYGKFLAGTQGQQKLIFGWPITTTLTKTPGVVNFAVRIYSLDQDGFKYSFMTLPSAVQIKESLKGGGEDKAAFIREADIEDASANIVNRIVNSTGAYDEHSPVPEIPIITKDIHFYTLDDNKYDEPIVETSHDLGENENINLAVSAKPGDAGILTYAWHKTPFNTTTGEYDLADVLVAGATTIIEYVADDGGDNDQQYYKKDGDTYTLITDDYSGQKYIKIARISAAAGESPAGIYYPEVQARLLVNSSATSKDGVETVTIPGPAFPTITDNEETTVHVIKDTENQATIAGTKISVEGATLSAKLIDSEGDPIAEVSEVTSGEAPSFTIRQGDPDKTYTINAFATRNKATVKTEGKIQYRVTAAPVAPNIGYLLGGQSKVLNGNMSDYDGTDDTIIWQNAKRTQPVITSETYHGTYTYYWIDPKITGITGSPTGSNLFTVLNTYKEGDFASLIASINEHGVTDSTFDGVTVLKTGEAFYNTGILWPTDAELNELADGETSYTDYEGDQGGAFSEITPVFCLVVNELNGHYAAAASTFYLV